MKRITNLALVMITSVFIWAQTDTVTLIYRDKKVEVKSDEYGQGKSKVTFNDGVKDVLVEVDFDPQNALLDSTESVQEQNFFVRKTPYLWIGKKKVHLTVGFSFGSNYLANLYAFESAEVINGQETYSFTKVENNRESSDLTRIDVGLSIPTSIKHLTLHTGLGFYTHKLNFRGEQFNIYGENPHSFSEVGFDYIPTEVYRTLPVGTYGRTNESNYINKLVLPIAAKYTFGNTNWYTEIGLSADFLLTSKMLRHYGNSKDLFGIHLDDDGTPSYYDEGSLNANFRRVALSGRLEVGKGLVGLFVRSNLTPYFTPEFYTLEDEKTDFYKKDNNRRSVVRLLEYGVKLNVF